MVSLMRLIYSRSFKKWLFNFQKPGPLGFLLLERDKVILENDQF